MADVDAPCLPIALLPVRIETKYRDSDTKLAIRIFPDTLHVDAHEPKLTDDEFTAGTAYAAAARAGDAAQQKAWTTLASLFGPPRAAWIARLMSTTSTPDRRTSKWERTPMTNVLPDRWVARGYKDGRAVFTQTGHDIPDNLALGPSLNAAVPTEGLPIDDGMRWLVDFDRAQAVGMGILVQLPQQGQQLDQLIVVGVKGTLETPTPAKPPRLQALLAAHHYTDGLGFVPEQTPTNNTPDAPAGYSSRDDDYSQSFAIETKDQRGNKDDRGAAWSAADALGISADVFANVRNANAGAGMERARAAMNTVLWPSTWGYFLTQMLADPITLRNDRITENGLNAARAHFTSWVRACGPPPVLRIGNQPYGVLPAISLDHWQPVGGDADVAGLVPLLQSGVSTLRAFWRQSLKNVPVAGSGGDFVRALSLQPRSVSYRGRNVLGPDYIGALFRYFHETLGDAWRRAQDTVTAQPLQQLQLANWHPRLEGSAWGAQWYPFTGPAVQSPSIAASAYLNALANPGRSSWRQLRDESYTGLVVPRPSPLLYLFARSSLLAAYAFAAGKQLGKPVVETELVEIDPDVYSVDAQVDPPLVAWDLLDGTGGALGANAAQVEDVRSSLATLAPLAPPTLEQLLAESLDLCSYRLDAWMTSLASRRLNYFRPDPPAYNTLVGGYGWGENLAPSRLSSATGYVAAPSIAHASAAAVLASGHLAHQGRGGPDSKALAVDLRSARVRQALWLLDGVRQGQTLPSLLGYRFERALQDAGAAAAAIPAFRKAFPLVGSVVGNGASGAAATASNAVVDGLSLSRAWASLTVHDRSAFGHDPFPPVTVKPDDVVDALNKLGDAVDALSDSLLAEGVYQLARGNPTRGAAALEAMSTGSSIPAELEFASTPRTGTGFTHRLLVLLQAAAVTKAKTPRALAEPSLNRWAAYVLGDPTKIVARVDWHRPDGSVVATQNVSIDELLPTLSTLDIVYSEQAEGATELERRLLFHARRHRPPKVDENTHVTAFLGRVGTAISFADVLELARTVRDVLANTRPLGSADLQRPDVAATGAPNAAELTLRANAALAALDALARELAPPSADAEPLRVALLKAASFGIAGAIPPDSTAIGPAAAAALAPQVTAVRAEIDRRRTAANPPATSPPLDPVQAALDRLHAVFGTGFRVAPTFSGVPAPFDLAFKRSAALQGSDTTAAVSWLQRMARVRPGASRLNEVLTYAEVIGTGPTSRLSVEQLPYPPAASMAAERWCALRFAGGTPPAGRVGFAVHVAPRADGKPLDATQPLVGLVVDEWTEVVPSATETAGIALDAPTPGTSPPQAIVLAVPPDASSRWTTDTLMATVAQTFELARIRSVDVDALDGLGQYLPATYFAVNLSDATPSTDLQSASARAIQR